MKKTEKQDYDSNPFTISFRGFGYFVDFAKSTFIAMLVLGVIGFGINTASEIADNTSTTNGNSSEFESFLDDFNEGNPEFVAEEILSIIFFMSALVITAFCIAVLVGTLFNAVYGGVVAAAANSSSKQKEITLGEAFREMSSRFGVLYLSILVATVRTIGGYLLFIIPGIRAQLRYAALPYVVMGDKNLGTDAALLKTKELYKGHLMESFGILTVGSIIPLVGSTIKAGGLSLSWQQIERLNKANSDKPKTHWLNYIGFILILLFVLFLGLFIGVVYTLSQN